MVTRTGRPRQMYPDNVRDSVVSYFMNNDVTVREAADKFGPVTTGAVRYWVDKQYGAGTTNALLRSRVKPIPKPLRPNLPHWIANDPLRPELMGPIPPKVRRR